MSEKNSALVQKSIWYFFIVISVFSIIILSTGFIKAMKVTYNAKIALDGNEVNTSSSAPIHSAPQYQEKNSIAVAIMGDSIARGAGDESGKGLSGYIPFYFRNLTSKEIAVENVGINGLLSDGFLEQLKSGNLDELIADSDYIVISIGGNDAREILSERGISRDEEFTDILDHYLSNLKDSLKLIRDKNLSCKIVLLELYNPYQKRDASENNMLLNDWNFQTGRLLENDKNAISIPTNMLFKFNLDRFIAPDGLHPNSAGYRAIAELISTSVGSFLVKGN